MQVARNGFAYQRTMTIMPFFTCVGVMNSFQPSARFVMRTSSNLPINKT